MTTTNKTFIAQQSININVPISKVWDALINPKLIKQYMFDTDAVSDWKEGSPLIFKGEWKGKKYDDKGIILKMEPNRIFQYSHFSPVSGVPDVPENYHIVTIELEGKGEQTKLTLCQDNNKDEETNKHSEKMWGSMLEALKKLLEK